MEVATKASTRLLTLGGFAAVAAETSERCLLRRYFPGPAGAPAPLPPLTGFATVAAPSEAAAGFAVPRI